MMTCVEHMLNYDKLQKVSYVQTVCSSVKSDIKRYFFVFKKFFNLFFICTLCDKSASFEFFINCHINYLQT